MLWPSSGFCGTPFSIVGAGTPTASRMVGMMSITWWNWVRRPPLSLIRAGQEMTMPFLTAPRWETICLKYWKGVSIAMRPADRVMVAGHGRAQLVQMRFQEGDTLLDPVHERDVVEQALRPALGARAVVALDIDDHRVVEFPLLAQHIDDPPDLAVVIGQRRGIDLHHVGIDLLLVGRERLPGGDNVGPRRQLRVGRYDAQRLLARQRLLAHLVPALVELALELRDPVLRRLVRRMRRAGCIVDEERLVGRQRLALVDPGDRVIGQIVVQDVIRLAVRWIVERRGVLQSAGWN